MAGYQHEFTSARRPVQSKLYIEAVTTCVDYSDFLAYSILFNKQHFDRLVVVTAPHDEPTRRLCEYHNVEYVVTPEFYTDKDWKPRTNGQGRLYTPPFAKSRGINRGLEALDGSGFVVHLDSDIVLPPRAREMIDMAQPDPSYIYGIDRLMSKNFEEWALHLAYPEVQHDANIFIRGNTFPFNVRVAAHREEGYVPIGFFQLWNPSASGIASYPEEHNDAGRTDMQFARRWPRAKRGIIPEIIAIHLESESAHMGANWQGRKTKFFGPDGYDLKDVQRPKKSWL